MINAFQNNITMTRGDDCKINIEISTADGEVYTPADGDVVKLYVKKEGLEKSLEEQPEIITKTFEKVSVENTDGEGTTTKLVATIAAADTKNLETGMYKYGVKLTTAEGKVYTVVMPSTFTIEEGIAK
ncbi:MAG: hypothetical protein DBY32_04120 [Phascolarctobacterium sp.]|nr:MAG: hypothetical protein DBY32_04120 [Phascolarctobacterium sp.]